MVELVVVLALLGVLLLVTALSFEPVHAPRESDWARELVRARAAAIRSGHPVRADVPPSTGPSLPAPLFWPDGSALGPGVDPLTGLANGND